MFCFKISKVNQHNVSLLKKGNGRKGKEFWKAALTGVISTQKRYIELLY